MFRDVMVMEMISRDVRNDSAPVLTCVQWVQTQLTGDVPLDCFPTETVHHYMSSSSFFTLFHPKNIKRGLTGKFSVLSYNLAETRALLKLQDKRHRYVIDVILIPQCCAVEK